MLRAALCARACAGNSIFFPVKRIEDPIGLLPAKLILGINKRGVHFFRSVRVCESKKRGGVLLTVPEIWRSCAHVWCMRRASLCAVCCCPRLGRWVQRVHMPVRALRSIFSLCRRRQ